MSEIIPGATAACLTHLQCVDLIESAEDTFNSITSNLSYLLHQEQQKADPDTALIAIWEALLDEVLDLGHFGLLEADVDTYQQVIKTYQQRNRELNAVSERYMAAAKQ
ncbi:hypothetical protein Pfra02_43780 [Pseudomonas fragi]|nr:hypothetical protein Pfra02_43780 [Pseudomonas fragi]